jgi:hypothetical protein
MRKLFPQAVLLLLCLYTNQSRAGIRPLSDTVKINHAIDGNISEWKVDSFETDKETQVQYAIDHDPNFLYVAVKIADQRTQMKIMLQGMNMFLDKKGKHREGTGINFPLQQPMEVMRYAFAGNRDAQTPPDPKVLREVLAKNMILLKTFGFDDQEDKTQMVIEENGINVSYDWDEANNMYIEYLVPMRFLGKNTDLNGKQLSLGWQVLSVSQGGSGSAAPVVTSTTLVGVNRSTGATTSVPGRTGGRAGNAVPASEFSKSSSAPKEHIFWTKHTLSF